MKHTRPHRSLPLLAAAAAAALALGVQAQAQTTMQQPSGNGQMSAQSKAGAQGMSWRLQQALRASHVIGSSVRNPQGQDIGQIEDMLVNLETGKTRYAILSFDPGWFHLERQYAVPVERLRMLGDQVVMDIPRDRLEHSGLESSGWSKDYFDDAGRIARLDRNWGLGDRAPESLVRASRLMRAAIISPNGDRIGEVEELVFSPMREQVQYVVVSFDRGWLGTDKRVAVDPGSLHRSGRADAYTLLVDQAAAQALRPFTEDRYAYFGDGGFVNRDSRRAMGAGSAVR